MSARSFRFLLPVAFIALAVLGWVQLGNLVASDAATGIGNDLRRLFGGPQQRMHAVIVELSALVALTGYLCVSVCLRNRHRWSQQWHDAVRARAFRRRWRPAGLDASSIQGQIDNVRRDYCVPIHNQARHAGYRNRLISSVRGTISRFAFFQSVRAGSPDSSEQELHKPV